MSECRRLSFTFLPGLNWRRPYEFRLSLWMLVALLYRINSESNLSLSLLLQRTGSCLRALIVARKRIMKRKIRQQKNPQHPKRYSISKPEVIQTHKNWRMTLWGFCLEKLFSKPGERERTPENGSTHCGFVDVLSSFFWICVFHLLLNSKFLVIESSWWWSTWNGFRYIRPSRVIISKCIACSRTTLDKIRWGDSTKGAVAQLASA